MKKGDEGMTQNQMILRHLKTHKRGITQAEAYEKYGILRLSGRIFNLREDGYEIKTDIIPVKNRRGDTCYVASYTLES